MNINGGNSNSLNPVIVPPMTIEELNRKLQETTSKIMGVTGAGNVVVLVRDMVIPELTIEQQALLDAITPAIGADGQWWIGNVPTGIMAAGYVSSPDGKIWKLSGISNTGTNPTFTVVYDPMSPP